MITPHESTAVRSDFSGCHCPLRRRFDRRGADRPLVLGLMAGMVNFVAHGLVDNAFFLVDLAFAFMLMLALISNIQYLLPDTQLSISNEGNEP